MLCGRRSAWWREHRSGRDRCQVVEATSVYESPPYGVGVRAYERTSVLSPARSRRAYMASR